MAPGAKRKRGDRTYSQESNDSGSRPSPHRPQNLGIAHAHQQNSNGRGGRRSSRTGRGGSSTPHSPTVAQASPSAMSPPAMVPPSTKSHPAHPTSAQALPSNDSSSDLPDSPSAPKFNLYLTPERVSSWSGAGRKAVVEDGVAAQAQGDMLTLSLLFEELVQACVDQTLAADALGSTVREILASPASDALDPASIFLDTASTLMEAGTALTSLKPMLEASGVDPMRMRGELDTNLLTALNLVRPTFSRVAIRKATHALYRQSNYNLLREETEGYSKLITEYFTTVHNEPPKVEVVIDTFQRVKALIGAFDLDVGRVLDVTLDVFANLLVKHTRFFVKLLRLSSWWPDQKVPHGIEWEEPGVSALPRWALPTFANWYYTEDEKEEQLRLREIRDRKFWSRIVTSDMTFRSTKSGLDAYFELGARRIIGSPSFKADTGTSTGAPKEMPDFEKVQKWSQEWMANTKTLPPSGNRIAAQLLGFKLRFYASDARDVHDTLPDNLIYLAALLIKIGFISLVDLYPHLYPLDEDMPALKDKLEEAKKEQIKKLKGQSGNALTMAAPLSDDTLPVPVLVTRLRESESKPSSKPDSERATPARAEEEVAENLPEPVDQKTALLRSLLCIGAIPEALYILGKFPWLLDVYPDLHDYVFRLLHHSLTKVYSWSRPFPSHVTTPKQTPINGAGPHGPPRTSDYPPRRTLRWAKLEEKDAGDGIDYRFYWEDWLDNVPICQTVDDVFKLCDSLLGLVGPEMGKDPMLLTKLARIGKKSLMEDNSTKNLGRWTLLCSTLLGPALTFSGTNPGAVNEVWELFKYFDTKTRFIIYKNWFTSRSVWKEGSSTQVKFLEVDAETKILMNRISKENVKTMGKVLAKVAHACPGIVFDKAAERFENYGNFVDVLVECCRFLTYLGYDCLTWSLTNSLSKGGRQAVQADGMLTSPWLKNAAEFIGKVCRRYSNMDPVPVLQYFLDQLCRTNPSMLAVLEQIITSMGGIGSYVTLTETQVLGISAGPRLRAFTLEHYLGDQQHLSRPSARRLMRSLKSSGLCKNILIALAIEVRKYLARNEIDDMPLKVLGITLDNLYSGFAQFLDLLRSNLHVNDFDAVIPGVVELMEDYRVDPPLAFAICRESISMRVNAARAEGRSSPMKLRPEPKNPQANGDVIMGGTEGESAVKVDAAAAESIKIEVLESQDVEMKDSLKVDDSSTPKESSMLSANPTPWRSNSVIEALADQLKTTMPKQFGNHVCLSFYITFWQLSLGDLVNSVKEYNAAQNYFAEKAKSIDTRRDVSVQATRKRDSERQAMTDLLREATDGMTAVKRTAKQLQEEMHQWFDRIPMVDARTDVLYDTILQDCFLPRIQLSSHDAQFAAAMLRFMHSSGVPGFRTMKLLDQLFRFRFLSNLFYMCTSRESQNIGRFLNDILKELKTWHTSQDNYTKFATGQKRLPGFGRTFNADRTPITFLDYEDFRRVLFKWHTNLFRALESCLKNEEYMHIRNAINVLKAVAPNFPVIDSQGKSLHQQVQIMSQTESREDLKLAAMSLLGDFKKGEKLWVPSQTFHHVRVGPNAPNAGGRVTSEQPTTPQPVEKTTPKALNTTAPKFTPKQVTLNGVSNSDAKPSNEHEDGEVEDEKTKTATAAANTEPRLKGPEPRKSTPNPVEQPPTTPSHQKEAEQLKLRNARPDTHSSKASTSQGPPLAPMLGRPDSRGTIPHQPTSVTLSRVPHALPSRPDALPPRARPIDRPGPEPPTQSRNDPRNKANAEFGRLDRPTDNLRESFPDRREPSPPGRRLPPRARTPDRAPNSMDRRDPGWGRDPREYHDDRSMRPPPRDGRGPPLGRGPSWPDNSRDLRDPRDPRELRDARDARDRVDPRGPLPPPDNSRTRVHSSTGSTDDTNTYRRDFTPKNPQGGDRAGQLPLRPPIDRSTTNVPVPASDRAQSAGDRPLINPDRAAFIEGDRGRNDPFRSERDSRRERGSRPQSPRRADDRNTTSYHNRNEVGRDNRDDRNNERGQHGRDHREEPTGHAPTGPRGGRNEFTESPMSTRVTREMFQPSHSSRVSQSQDPNYGRLKPTVDPIPSGPRNLMTDRRDQIRRESASHEQTLSTPPPPLPPPTGPAQQDTSGVHPSRLNQIHGPPLQTDMPRAPSGPRNAARTPHGPSASPSTRAAPTGPASTERNGRTQDKSSTRALSSSFNQGAPTAPGSLNDRNAIDRGTSIRGRGSRASGPIDALNMPSPAGSHSHPSTPNTTRPEGPLSRSDRPEHASNRPDNHAHDDGRVESRSSRDGRRGDRSGRRRSRSPDRGDRRPDERSARNDELEKVTDRERGSGREKRGGDGARRDGERSARDGKERRDRGGREEGMGSGRGEDTNSRRGPNPALAGPPQWTGDGRGEIRSGEPRVRTGGDRREDRDRRGGRDDGRDGRKRARGGDDAAVHSDNKRPRRSVN
ncbi:uncharacterized protein BDR25DRAFT_106691 [Lindgomyces ingoldianus]|uniref:Uncharacterized protein n=1 Tax=Lindgomyces ingoldianus TaxID=673940 RepID=A0ACB6Q9L5_9PLEO|nr:uncharacterized protein BDR25DRAFT_106691 [Lindgomyces ingoldianus]KAF2463724.1 hypothetical protein BDR25DRAFT_106691 [Lindgomyces ingoldianus]